jgi:hypothetical protein
MFGKKLVSDSLLAAVKGVTSGEQIDSNGSELLVGDAVQVQEGPHAGKIGTISGFQNTGRSEVQLNHGPSVALYNETLLNEEDADGTKPKWTDNHKGLYTPKQHKDRLERLRKHKESSKSTPKLRKGSKLAKGWDPTESYNPEVEEGFLSGESKYRALMKSYDRRKKKADSVQLSPEMLKKAGERQRADLTKTVPAGQPFSATDAAYKRRQAKKAKNEEYYIDEAATHKVGDTVIASKGPHKGVKHKVIHDHGNGKYNVQPVGLDVKHIKYRQGAATAHGKHLTPNKGQTKNIDRDMVKKSDGSLTRKKMAIEMVSRMRANRLDEANKGTIARSVRKGTGPFTAVVVDKQGKVVEQEHFQHADAAPAFVSELKKRWRDHPRAGSAGKHVNIHIEDKGGSVVYNDSSK